MATALQPGVTTTTPAATTEPPPVDTNNPAFLTPAYLRMKAKYQRCRDLMEGVDAIRAGEDIYLKQLEGESDESYAFRVMIGALHNGFARTVVATVGMILLEEIELEDMPQELEDLWENADAGGTHGMVLTSDLILNSVVDGHAGLFVDCPDPDDPTIDRSNASAAAEPGAELSSDDEEALGIRPYFILVKADEVILPLYQKINGQKTLVLFIRQETTTERVGDFGVQSVVYYRIYSLEKSTVQYQSWRLLPGESRPTLFKAKKAMRVIKRIPWSPLRSGRKKSDQETAPPLLDLADLNIQHHQVQTNILSLESLAEIPTLVRIGAVPDDEGDYPPITLGPRNTIEVPYPQDGQAIAPQPVYWLSPPIEVLTDSMKTLEDTKKAMAEAGAAFLNPNTAVAETATGRSIDSMAQNASVKTVGRATQDCLELAFQYAAEFLGIEAGSVKINMDFEAKGIDPAYLAVLVTAYSEGVFPADALLYALKTGELPPEFAPEQEALLLVTKQRQEADAQDLANKKAAAALAAAGGQPPKLPVAA
ncbi:MAG TPA: DUF4055 domain-containing protein [Reyranella sp.]|nr:DUF4055 domain-containing protein [Reyranella sp.]